MQEQTDPPTRLHLVYAGLDACCGDRIVNEMSQSMTEQKCFVVSSDREAHAQFDDVVQGDDQEGPI
jgi:hypothetical protein